MKNVSEIYGAAQLGGKLHAARVENDGARSKVTSFLTSDDNLTGNILGGGQLFFCIDGPLAVVKKIQIKQSGSLDSAEMARFEMSQSLLDPPDQFYFDTFPIGARNGYMRLMSIAYHRSEVDRLIETYQSTLCKPSGFKLDAVALAHGYTAFCRIEPGDLQVLADIETDRVTLAILYREKLYGVGRLETSPGDDISLPAAGKLAAEFKLILSFHLAELFQEGITIPLSRIIVSGRHARDELLTAAIKEQFSTDVVLPHFHEGYFQPCSETIDRYPPERFLIPMGLAVE